MAIFKTIFFHHHFQLSFRARSVSEIETWPIKPTASRNNIFNVIKSAEIELKIGDLKQHGSVERRVKTTFPFSK